jgi:chemosensory pili system protein ChpA (sensor histidine kinase/response regulator)
MSSNSVESEEIESSAADLGPLAWVLDELRKSLDGATKALRRFVRDAELARGSDLSELDASHLRIARQQLHQGLCSVLNCAARMRPRRWSVPVSRSPNTLRA